MTFSAQLEGGPAFTFKEKEKYLEVMITVKAKDMSGHEMSIVRQNKCFEFSSIAFQFFKELHANPSLKLKL